MEYDTENIDVRSRMDDVAHANLNYACCESIVADSQWPLVLTKSDRI